jgi:hypothetical protein
MPARTLIDARGQKFTFGDIVAFGQDEAPIAVAALDIIRFAHLKPYSRVAKCAANAVTGDAAGSDRDDLGLRGIGGRQGGGLSSQGARLGGGPSSA